MSTVYDADTLASVYMNSEDEVDLDDDALPEGSDVDPEEIETEDDDDDEVDFDRDM